MKNINILFVIFNVFFNRKYTCLIFILTILLHKDFPIFSTSIEMSFEVSS